MPQSSDFEDKFKFQALDTGYWHASMTTLEASSLWRMPQSSDFDDKFKLQQTLIADQGEIIWSITFCPLSGCVVKKEKPLDTGFSQHDNTKNPVIVANAAI
jgi:hypothetical protein